MNYFVRILAGFTVHIVILFSIIFSQILLFTADTYGITASECLKYANSIIDYSQHLNPQFKKIKRNRTRYIIIHTSECDLKTTLKIVSKGKQENHRWVSRGGHTHYVIARNGQTYSILGHEYRAHHAGLSMWNGELYLNRSSIGIELVGYHNQDITAKQYKSIQLLIKILKNKYHLDDIDVLTHSQIAYSKPNEYNPYKHRGRKHCAQNFDRIRAGLNAAWHYDPDVKAGRLAPEPKLAAIFYENR